MALQLRARNKNRKFVYKFFKMDILCAVSLKIWPIKIDFDWTLVGKWPMTDCCFCVIRTQVAHA